MEQRLVVFHFDRIYLKDASFESPRSPSVFSDSDYNPKIDVQLHISHQKLNGEQELYEVVLKATVKATANDETAFLVEVQQAGIFTVNGLDKQQLGRVLESSCPSALFPFLREQVSQLVTQGGFPTVLLQPVNFEAMYENKMLSENDTGEEATTH
jgi:preprotein translocase subunit SecB